MREVQLAGHPRVRLSEADLDRQVLELFDRMKIEDQRVRDWFLKVLRARTRSSQEQAQQKQAELSRQLTLLRSQQDRLLNLRLHEEIDADTFATKNAELRERIADLKLQVEAGDQSREQQGRMAEKAFELSQSLKEKWISAETGAKRQILEIVCLNFTLDGVTLVPQMRKPFDLLAEGLVLAESRGGEI